MSEAPGPAGGGTRLPRDRRLDQPGVMRWLKGTPNRSFVLYPLLVAAFEFAIHRGAPVIVPWGALLMAWGYLQYRLSGTYRIRHGGGGPGIAVPPTRIVAEGPYRYTRNPMYMGHMIFMLGLAVTFWSWLGLAIFVFHLFWFNNRAADDETHLRKLFGADYEAYRARVKRWVPGIY